MIVDTNTVSAYAEGERSAVKVVNSAPFIALPVIVIGEYRYGLANSIYRKKYERWFDEFLSYIRILPITQPTSTWYAEIRTQLRKDGKPIPANDLWIAASAAEHGLAVISRDGHFDDVKAIRRVGW